MRVVYVLRVHACVSLQESGSTANESLYRVNVNFFVDHELYICTLIYIFPQTIPRVGLVTAKPEVPLPLFCTSTSGDWMPCLANCAKLAARVWPSKTCQKSDPPLVPTR